MSPDKPIDWAAVAEEALGVIKVAADVAAKKAADEIYARVLDSAQDYLTDNLRFNIASTLETAERERKAAQDRVGGLLEALRACRTNIAGYNMRDGSEAPRLVDEFFNELQRIHKVADAALARSEGRA